LRAFDDALGHYSRGFIRAKKGILPPLIYFLSGSDFFNAQLYFVSNDRLLGTITKAVI
jgi:hypothetical protein